MKDLQDRLASKDLGIMIEDQLLPVLEYIDDAIILAEDPETLQKMLREIEFWTYNECLEISIEKT